MSIFNRTKTTKVYRGKNGYTATFTKIRTDKGPKWIRTGGGTKVKCPRKIK